MKMEDDLKISKGEYLSNHCMDRDIWVHLRWKLRGNLECGSAQPSLSHTLSILFFYTYFSLHLSHCISVNASHYSSIHLLTTGYVSESYMNSDLHARICFQLKTWPGRKYLRKITLYFVDDWKSKYHWARKQI